MRKSFLKAAIPTMAMLLVAVMALTGTTYAWFTTSKTASVASVNVRITTAEGMKIAVKTASGDSGWKSTLTADEVVASKDANWSNDFKTKLDATSTTNTINSNHGLSFFVGELDPDNEDNLQTVTADSSNFIRFDIYVQNNSNTDKWCSLRGSNVSGNADAMRVALIPQGTHAGTEFAEITNGAAAGSSALMWANSNDSTKGLKAEYSSTPSVAMGDSAIAAAQVIKTDWNDLRFQVPSSSIAKVTIYFWLEGQDTQCTNALAAAAAGLELTFDMSSNAQ